MLKKSLLAVAAIMLLAGMANAGELKIHDWPTTYIPQEVCDIPVLMDIGYWINIKDQDKLKIKLEQISITVYEGCTTIKFDNNFDLTFKPTIAAENDPVSGLPVLTKAKYETWANPADVDAGIGNTTQICAKITLDGGSRLGGTTAGAKNVHVATVTVKVIPR
jgi:hypothetical protein